MQKSRGDKWDGDGFLGGGWEQSLGDFLQGC